MTALRVHNAQRVRAGGKVKFHFFDFGILRVTKINRNKRADGASGLIHQAAGLAEVFVFGVLRDFRNRYRVHFAVIIQIIEHGAHEHLICRRGRKPRTGQHAGRCCRVKAADFIAVIQKALAHAAHKRRGMAEFRRLYRQIGQIHHIHRVALAFHAHNIVLVFCRRRNRVQIDARREHSAVIMVGVVAADLGSAGGGEQTNVPRARKQFRKCVDNGSIPRILRFDFRVGHIHAAKSFIECAAGQHCL